jgi:hypothetical protein
MRRTIVDITMMGTLFKLSWAQNLQKQRGFPRYMKTKTNYDKCKLNFKSKHKIEKSNIKT